jgi:hypothetical protein
MPRAAVGGKRRVEGKGRKANTSARGDRRKNHRAEDGGRDLGTGGGEAFAEQIQVSVGAGEREGKLANEGGS